MVIVIVITALIAHWNSFIRSPISYQNRNVATKLDDSSSMISSDTNKTTSVLVPAEQIKVTSSDFESVPSSDSFILVYDNNEQEEKLFLSSLDDNDDRKEECTLLPDLSSFDNPGEVNSLRRTLGLEKPTCYTQYLPVFENYTRIRLSNVKQHLSLHIPKTGGTSLCQLARSHNISTPKTNNCYEFYRFNPIWCCFKFGDRQAWHHKNGTLACDALDNKLSNFAFTMNENYLDHPLCMNDKIHSVLLREPIERGLSQERHVRGFNSQNPMLPNVLSVRLNMTRNNYMTWALAIGSINTTSKVTTKPDRDLLEVAKTTLLQLDFLYDPLSSRDEECNSAILKLMNFNSTKLQHTNKAKTPKLSENITREQYTEWNALDIELYQYATKLMELDCNFFLRLVNETES